MIHRAQRSHHQRGNTTSIAAIGIYGAAMLPPPRSRSQCAVRMLMCAHAGAADTIDIYSARRQNRLALSLFSIYSSCSSKTGSGLLAMLCPLWRQRRLKCSSCSRSHSHSSRSRVHSSAVSAD